MRHKNLLRVYISVLCFVSTEVWAGTGISHEKKDSDSSAQAASSVARRRGERIIYPESNKSLEELQKEAAQGNTESMCQLGVLYWNRAVSKGSGAAEAIDYIRQAMDLGHVNAIGVLGELYRQGVPGLLPEAPEISCVLLWEASKKGSSYRAEGRSNFSFEKMDREFYLFFESYAGESGILQIQLSDREGADRGDREALRIVGERYLKDNSLRRGVALLEQAIHRGDVPAMRILGEHYLTGAEEMRNEHKGLVLLKEASRRKDVLAMRILGEHLQKKGPYQNQSKGIKFLAEAATAKDAQARQLLSRCIRDLRQAAQMRDVSAMRILGKCFLKGRGVDQNEQAGLSWVQKAADKQDIKAMRVLGESCLKGGVVKDEKKFEALLTRAVDGGDVRAMRILGEYYLDTRGIMSKLRDAIQRTENKGVVLLRQAVDKQDIKAMRILGERYHQGNGVTKDLQKAQQLRKQAELHASRHSIDTVVGASLRPSLTTPAEDTLTRRIQLREAAVDGLLESSDLFEEETLRTRHQLDQQERQREVEKAANERVRKSNRDMRRLMM